MLDRIENMNDLDRKDNHLSLYQSFKKAQCYRKYSIPIDFTKSMNIKTEKHFSKNDSPRRKTLTLNQVLCLEQKLLTRYLKESTYIKDKRNHKYKENGTPIPSINSSKGENNSFYLLSLRNPKISVSSNCSRYINYSSKNNKQKNRINLYEKHYQSNTPNLSKNIKKSQYLFSNHQKISDYSLNLFTNGNRHTSYCRGRMTSNERNIYKDALFSKRFVHLCSDNKSLGANFFSNNHHSLWSNKIISLFI